MDGTLNDQVVQANIDLHTQLADSYNTNEPHFRPENVAKVEARLLSVLDQSGRGRMLDLGCGTGFMIDIAKAHVEEIHGVDITQAMMDQVDRSGPARIELHRSDTGAFEPEPGTFDVVTAYSFLHHLADIRPTLATAAAALRPGGRFYADLEPNQEFWSAIGELGRGGSYDPIVTREIEMVTFKDEDIEKQFGVDGEVFNLAEYGKSTAGGFSGATIRTELESAGFTDVQVFYEWFVGQGQMINEPGVPREEGMARAAIVDGLLQRALPLSRSLFKYLGFVATRA